MKYTNDYVGQTVPLSFRIGRDEWKDRFTDMYESLSTVAYKVRTLLAALQRVGMEQYAGSLPNRGLQICNKLPTRGSDLGKDSFGRTNPHSPEELCDLLDQKAQEKRIYLATPENWACNIDPNYLYRRTALYEIAEGVVVVLGAPKVTGHERYKYPDNAFYQTFESTTDKLHLRLGLTHNPTQDKNFLEKAQQAIYWEEIRQALMYH